MAVAVPNDQVSRGINIINISLITWIQTIIWYYVPAAICVNPIGQQHGCVLTELEVC